MAQYLTSARRAALSHLIFNLFGVCWILIVFRPFIKLVCSMVGFDPTADLSVDPNASSRINFALCAFHTAFNTCNVLILVWFIPLFEKVVCSIIKGKEEDEDMRLRFISGGLMSTSELSLLEARKEINHFALRAHRMFGFVPQLLKLVTLRCIPTIT